MKKNRLKQANSVKSIIQKMTSNKFFGDGLRKVFIKKIWLNVMGKNVSQYTENIYIKNNTLFLKINSSALKQELSYGKDKIIDNFNNEIGSDEIKKIVFI
jgi:hypothetical protein|tara:strand:- start:52 stop:351 length:300 start_codon:yes stop_codon:yes gene_type:complete